MRPFIIQVILFTAVWGVYVTGSEAGDIQAHASSNETSNAFNTTDHNNTLPVAEPLLGVGLATWGAAFCILHPHDCIEGVRRGTYLLLPEKKTNSACCQWPKIFGGSVWIMGVAMLAATWNFDKI